YEHYLSLQPDGQHLQEAQDGVERATWERARADDTPGAYLAYLRQYPDGRFRDEAHKQFAALRAPVPGAVYTGQTSSGAPIRLTIDADGLTVVSLDVGLAASDNGSSAAPVAATGCYSIASLTLTNRAPIGDDDRAFSLTQHGSMDLVAGDGAVA